MFLRLKSKQKLPVIICLRRHDNSEKGREKWEGWERNIAPDVGVIKPGPRVAGVSDNPLGGPRG